MCMGGEDDILHARIAKALGWTIEETHGYPLLSLRELVRPIDAKLTAALTERIRDGAAIVGRWHDTIPCPPPDGCQ